MDVATLLRESEEKLLDPVVRRNSAVVSAMLADGFREFGSSGRVYTNEEIVAELLTESPACLTLWDFEARLLAGDIALVTYRSRRLGAAGIAIEALRSSIWIIEDGQWKVLFHQGTRLPLDPLRPDRNEFQE